MFTEKEPSYEPIEPNPILEKLGFRESSEMQSIKPELIKALRLGDNERISDLVDKYRELGEIIADEQETSRGRMGLDVALALILREAGREEDCIEYLEGVLYCAEQKGFEDVIAELESLTGQNG